MKEPFCYGRRFGYERCCMPNTVNETTLALNLLMLSIVGSHLFPRLALAYFLVVCILQLTQGPRDLTKLVFV
jgi:hypothetical protein